MKPAVLITGACGGIGSALCDVFAESGYHVVGIALSTTVGFPHAAIHCDIRTVARSQQSADELRAKVLEQTGGRLDVLVNNAALQIVKPCSELTRDDWANTLDTNLLAPFWLSRSFLPELRKVHGSIVNIGSIHARLTKREFVAYATSKGALETLTRAMALDFAPDVRVNAIAPAATDTPMLRAGFGEQPEKLVELERYHPLGRIASPTEVAKVVLFLAGHLTEFMTGTTIGVDGGIAGCLSDPA
jgi:NAD(P)-dependent dehydrogenase (short-subunit alcohol dehydrogenase family)